MFKPMTIGYYKQVRNNPRCKAEVDLMAGMVVVVDEAGRKAALPTAEEAKGEIWIVSNIIDKPEIRNKEDFTVLAGEYVRADFLADAKELPIELDFRVIGTDFDTINIGDKLVANAEGKWEVAVDTTGYAVSLEVIEKSGFGDKGVAAVVKIA